MVLTKKGNTTANRILGLFFLLWEIDFFDGALMLNGFYLEHPNLALWTDSFLFLYGPLIYFYTLFTIDGNKKFRISYLIHFLPFLLGFIVLLIIYHLQPIDYKLKILEGITTFNQPVESFIGFLFIYLHFFSYIFLSYHRLKNAERNLKNYYSYPILRWLYNLLFGLSIVLSLSIVSSIFQFLGATMYFNLSVIIILLSIGVFVGRLIFKSLDQQSPMLTQLSGRKYSGSDLAQNEVEAIRSKILGALDKDELFLDPELSLEKLSEKIGITKRNVSQVINEVMGKNFFDLINTYRIERAKRIFMKNKDPKLTVLEVLYEVGFNSKSSFNTQFKNKTGLTPSEFKRLNP
ncbi:MAG: helix-turn-helix domain-containing protein [Maribacter sp.]|uniref:helix-turn-helix domain-containing protein n=1 Tax=Maribacter sp. TaxID=1897614 RepID=UPI003C71BBF6